MAKPLRSPERAAAVLDRAARMSSFKPAWYDRGLFDTKLRTPGLSKSAIHINDIDPKSIKPLGLHEVPLSKIRTEQTTVSLAGVKEKLRNASNAPAQLILRKDGFYDAADGNHRMTAERALGKTTIKAHVGEIMGKQAMEAMKAAAQPAPTPAAAPANKMSIATKAGIGVSVLAVPAVVAADAFVRTTAKGATVDAAALEAAKAGGKSAAIGAGVTAAISVAGKALKIVAPKVAPVLGPVGMAAAAGMAAYGAYQGFQNTGTLAGAARGAIGLDTTTTRLAELQSQNADKFKVPAGGGAKGPMSVADAKKFEGANATFEQRLAATQQQPTAEGTKPTGGPRGFANPMVQYAAQAGRGVENFSDWAQAGGKSK